MYTFVLVLTIIGYSSQSGHAVTNVPGFSSAQECVEAGNAWLKHHRGTRNAGATMTAVCVKQKRLP